MKDLMMHVERIVRPVAAFAPRKLRMRRELLGHLQQAFEEEKARPGSGESDALGRALDRLGEPAELTLQLQKSVPLPERLLMSNLPLPHPLEQAERRAGATIYGRTGPLTLGHQTILALAVSLVVLPFYTPEIVRVVFTRSGAPAHPALFFCYVLLCLFAMIAVSYRLVSAAADPHRPLLRRGMIQLMSALLGLQIAYSILVAATAADRLPTIVDVSTSIAVTLLLLPCSLLLARWVAGRRPQYDEWLTLDLAQ